MMAKVPSRLVVLASVADDCTRPRHRPEEDPRHRQDQLVGDSSQSKDPVGQEGHDQQPADRSENYRWRHSRSIIINIRKQP